MYVGQAVDILRRWRQHRHRLKKRAHDNAHLQAAWLHYGEASFTFAVASTCAPASLGSEEIKLLATIPEASRYNIGVAGDSPTRGLRFSSQVRANMSRSKGGRPVVATNVASGETRRFDFLQQAVDFFGLSQGSVWACCAGKRPAVRGFVFEYVDVGDVEKVLPKPAKKPKRSRAVVGTNIDTGEETHFWRVSAVREKGLSREGVTKCLAGIMPTHGGCRWRYADGQPHAELDAAYKKKLSKARTRGPTFSRPIKAIHRLTGEVLTFLYIADAARHFGVTGSAISNCVAGRSKWVKGYSWMYEDNK